MSLEPEWVLLESYANSLEAELTVTALQSSGIPAQVRGLEVGIWGPGPAGKTVTGPTVWVPGNRLEEARDLRVPFDELGIELTESEESD